MARIGSAPTQSWEDSDEDSDASESEFSSSWEERDLQSATKILLAQEKQIQTDEQNALTAAMESLGIDPEDKQAMKGILLIQRMIRRRRNIQRFRQLIKEYSKCEDASQLLERNRYVADLIHSWDQFGPRLELFNDRVVPKLQTEVRKNKTIFDGLNLLVEDEKKLHEESIRLWRSFNKATLLTPILEIISRMLGNYREYCLNLDEALALFETCLARSKSFRLQACSLATVFLTPRDHGLQKLKFNISFSGESTQKILSNISEEEKASHDTIKYFKEYAGLPFLRLEQLKNLLGNLVEVTPPTYQDRPNLVATYNRLSAMFEDIQVRRNDVKRFLMNDPLPPWCHVSGAQKKVGSVASVTVNFLQNAGKEKEKEVSKRKKKKKSNVSSKTFYLAMSDQALYLFCEHFHRETIVIPAYTIAEFDPSGYHCVRVLLKEVPPVDSFNQCQLLEFKFKMVIVRDFFLKTLNSFPAKPPKGVVEATISSEEVKQSEERKLLKVLSNVSLQDEIEDWKRMGSLQTLLSLRKGEYALRAGDAVDGVYHVVSGQVAIGRKIVQQKTKFKKGQHCYVEVKRGDESMGYICMDEGKPVQVKPLQEGRKPRPSEEEFIFSSHFTQKQKKGKTLNLLGLKGCKSGLFLSLTGKVVEGRPYMLDQESIHLSESGQWFFYGKYIKRLIPITTGGPEMNLLVADTSGTSIQITFHIHGVHFKRKKSKGLGLFSSGKQEAQMAYFATPLAQLCQRERSDVPRLVTLCIEELKKHHQTQGLFRISGQASMVDEYREMFDEFDYNAGAEALKGAMVHNVAGLLKLFLRDLPDSVFSSGLYPIFLSALESRDFEEILAAYKRMPLPNRRLAETLVEYLKEFSKYEEESLMSPENIAIVFGPSCFKNNDPNLSPVDQLKEAGKPSEMFLMYFRNFEKLKEAMQNKKFQDKETMVIRFWLDRTLIPFGYDLHGNLLRTFVVRKEDSVRDVLLRCRKFNVPDLKIVEIVGSQQKVVQDDKIPFDMIEGGSSLAFVSEKVVMVWSKFEEGKMGQWGHDTVEKIQGEVIRSGQFFCLESWLSDECPTPLDIIAVATPTCITKIPTEALSKLIENDTQFGIRFLRYTVRSLLFTHQQKYLTVKNEEEQPLPVRSSSSSSCSPPPSSPSSSAKPLLGDSKKLARKPSVPIPFSGKTKFFEEYDYSVQIGFAKDLPAMDKNGSSDPFVVITLNGAEIARTSVKKKTLNPIWEETFEVKKWPTSRSLMLDIFDEDIRLLGKKRAEYIGTVPIKPPGDEVVSGLYPVEGGSGSLFVSVSPINNQFPCFYLQEKTLIPGTLRIFLDNIVFASKFGVAVFCPLVHSLHSVSPSLEGTTLTISCQSSAPYVFSFKSEETAKSVYSACLVQQEKTKPVVQSQFQKTKTLTEIGVGKFILPGIEPLTFLEMSEIVKETSYIQNFNKGVTPSYSQHLCWVLSGSVSVIAEEKEIHSFIQNEVFGFIEFGGAYLPNRAVALSFSPQYQVSSDDTSVLVFDPEKLLNYLKDKPKLQLSFFATVCRNLVLESETLLKGFGIHQVRKKSEEEKISFAAANSGNSDPDRRKSFILPLRSHRQSFSIKSERSPQEVPQSTVMGSGSLTASFMG